MDADYGARYAELYRTHWWWRAREEVVLGEIRRLRREKGPARILDVGCGDGLFFDALSAFGEVQGVEPDSHLLTAGSRWSSAIANVPFDEQFSPGHRFDLILFLDVLEHMPDPVAALKHALRLLEAAGTIIVTVPAFTWLWTSHDDLNHHYTRYSKRQFRVLAHRAGAQIEAERYLFQWLVSAKLGVRLVEMVRRSPPAAPRPPARPVNELLRRYSRLEHRVAETLNPEFGSSLLVLLRHETGDSEEGPL